MPNTFFNYFLCKNWSFLLKCKHLVGQLAIALQVWIANFVGVIHLLKTWLFWWLVQHLFSLERLCFITLNTFIKTVIIIGLFEVCFNCFSSKTNPLAWSNLQFSNFQTRLPLKKGYTLLKFYFLLLNVNNNWTFFKNHFLCLFFHLFKLAPACSTKIS